MRAMRTEEPEAEAAATASPVEDAALPAKDAAVEEGSDTPDPGSPNLNLQNESEEGHEHHLERVLTHMESLNMGSLKLTLKERGAANVPPS